MNKSTQTPSYSLIMKQFLIQSVLFVGLFVILFSFQNCSTEMESDNSDLSSLGSSLPFAYDSTVDHLAYMSCSNMGTAFDANAMFSYKVGAYSSIGGLKFTDAFKAKTSQITPALVAQALSLSPTNAGVVQQLSLRDSTNYQYVLNVAGGVNSFAAPLSDSNISTVVAALPAGARANTFPGLPTLNQKFESKIYFSSTEGLAQQSRDLLQNGAGTLGVTFNQPSRSADNAIGDSLGSTSSVYGSGLSVKFKMPAGYTSGVARTLSTVTEKSLVNGAATAGSWSCSANYVFRVVRAADLGVRVVCNALNMTGEPNMTGATAAQIDTYNVMRKVLPSQYWALDIVNKCAVLRAGVTGQCYGNDPTNAINVQYAPGSSCSGSTCPHFVSVCKKL